MTVCLCCSWLMHQSMPSVERFAESLDFRTDRARPPSFSVCRGGTAVGAVFAMLRLSENMCMYTSSQYNPVEGNESVCAYSEPSDSLPHHHSCKFMDVFYHSGPAGSSFPRAAHRPRALISATLLFASSRRYTSTLHSA
ncbi:hypothetical protein PLICRDRAFT_311099 [Plicaturopsis crispa FD-325 SS-3]|nr:hypothetical protein PLICRDRAFT_311099 [Plicaturopsis crispa FD-325 SS-3]